ncbi:hypothetical protein [Salinibacter altiplanensis]|uniref:hypothetical protein n=1 Tax=Salinibacter altiplanensis TaxID=1803181 RepID=UPI000C9F42CF|nr:hypothetical protein [Salinibacter altiplanensis]
MDTRQGDLFEGNPGACECASCGRSFVPDWDSDKYCDGCFERKQRQQPEGGESGAGGKSGDEWLEGFYDQTGQQSGKD